ncbi:hypothetical protein [Bacillus sp. T33-2]|nr:hypothetical protein [Bacillus sp. T33-2]
MNQPSEETKKKILTFFLKTSVPRILAAKRLADKENDSKEGSHGNHSSND